MAYQKLTISEAKANASNFMYVFADENAFLRYIPSEKYANIIRGKKANQNKILMESAKQYNETYEAYTSAIRDGFIEQYGMTPASALVVLAQGGTVAGKNWSEGVFGVGATTNFTGSNVNASVNPDTGVTSVNGVTLGVTKIVYAEVNKETVPYQVVCTDNTTGITYVSQYNKGKYYASSYSTSDGQKYNAKGKTISDKDMGTIWEGILLNLEKFVDWLLSLFGGVDVNKNSITAENTLPDQKTDGFVYESGFGEGGMILLALAAGGLLMANGTRNNKKSK